MTCAAWVHTRTRAMLVMSRKQERGNHHVASLPTQRSLCAPSVPQTHTPTPKPTLTKLKSHHAPRPAFTSTPCSWHELRGCKTPFFAPMMTPNSKEKFTLKTSAPWPASSGRWLFGPAKVILDPGRMEAFFSCAYRLPAACNTVRVKLVCTTKVESL